MINTISFHWFSQHYVKCALKCINKLSLAISLKFPEGATLATTLAAKAWALAAIFVSENMHEQDAREAMRVVFFCTYKTYLYA